jgi:hypothetical protein
MKEQLFNMSHPDFRHLLGTRVEFICKGRLMAALADTVRWVLFYYTQRPMINMGSRNRYKENLHIVDIYIKESTMMIMLEELNTGTILDGEELEFFVDDDTMVGEVYLDGELIFQDVAVLNVRLLRLNFFQSWCELDIDLESNYG